MPVPAAEPSWKERSDEHDDDGGGDGTTSAGVVVSGAPRRPVSFLVGLAGQVWLDMIGTLLSSPYKDYCVVLSLPTDNHFKIFHIGLGDEDGYALSRAVSHWGE